MLTITGISPYIPHIWVLLGGFGRVYKGMARYAPVLRVYLGLPVRIPDSIIIHHVTVISLMTSSMYLIWMVQISKTLG